jgi:hypothetical protein
MKESRIGARRYRAAHSVLTNALGTTDEVVRRISS